MYLVQDEPLKAVVEIVLPIAVGDLELALGFILGLSMLIWNLTRVLPKRPGQRASIGLTLTKPR